MTTAALFFDPDGYLLTGSKLMGRQAAGHAFLRAVAAAHSNQPVSVYAQTLQSARTFAHLLKGFNPAVANIDWIPFDQIERVIPIGTLYFPGPGLGDPARLRLRVGVNAYSLVGVTHTVASHTAMDNITGLLDAPVMPWDALISTSSAVAASVKQLLERQQEYLQWRLGSGLRLTLPQLPVIPLGVHCHDFDFTPEDRQQARSHLQLSADEIVILFVGRLSFHAKAHPHPMYRGLQLACERTGQPLTLIQYGASANEAIAEAFRDGARRFCPAVKTLFVDGRDFDQQKHCWAAADLFISLSDNIQESFGLTPVEAMAAGLPVLVSDWDGYRETVRDGTDGFRLPTWMPPPDLGETYARAYEAGTDNYDFYCGLNCQTVSVDEDVLVDRLRTLIQTPSLRTRLGAAARQRAREHYDWAVVYRHYQALWSDLARIRQDASRDHTLSSLIHQAPRVAPGRQDPYRTFMHYPTHLLQPATRIRRLPTRPGATYPELLAHGLYNYAGKVLPRPEVAERLLCLCSEQAITLDELARQAGYALGPTALALSGLAKMGLIRLDNA